MNIWLKECENARELLGRFTPLLNGQCDDLFAIYEELSRLEEEIDDKYSGAIFCGLCAYAYRAAGLIKLVDAISSEINNAIDKLPRKGRSIRQKVVNHQNATKWLICDMKEYRNDTMHLAREVEVMMEHPYATADRSFYCRLQYIHDTLEAHMENLYEMWDELEKHPILKVDAAAIGRLKVIHSGGG